MIIRTRISIWSCNSISGYLYLKETFIPMKLRVWRARKMFNKHLVTSYYLVSSTMEESGKHSKHSVTGGPGLLSDPCREDLGGPLWGK